jgi:hypothetical protein
MGAARWYGQRVAPSCLNSVNFGVPIRPLLAEGTDSIKQSPGADVFAVGFRVSDCLAHQLRHCFPLQLAQFLPHNVMRFIAVQPEDPDGFLLDTGAPLLEINAPTRGKEFKYLLVTCNEDASLPVALVA